MPYFAFAVDLSGVAQASYQLVAEDDAAAAKEGRQYLEEHPVIEVWSPDYRRVARMVREPG